MDEEKVKLFVDEYNELCKKHGFALISVPQWRQSKDTGDFRLVIEVQVAEVKDESGGK